MELCVLILHGLSDAEQQNILYLLCIIIILYTIERSHRLLVDGDALSV